MDENELATLLQKLHEAESAVIETETRIEKTPANDEAVRSAARALEALRSAHEILSPAPKVRRSP